MTKPSRAEIARNVIDLARQHIAERGVNALNARDLAKAAGCSVGTLYNVYESLNEIIMRVNATTVDQLCETLKQADPGGAPDERLKALARTYLHFALDNRNLFEAAFHRANPDGPNYPSWFIERVTLLREQAMQVLAEVSPHAERQDLIDAAAVLWASVNGLTVSTISGKLKAVTTTSSEALIDQAAAILARGMSLNHPSE